MRNHKELGWVKWFCLGTLAGAIIAIPIVTLAKSVVVRNNAPANRVSIALESVEPAQLVAPEVEKPTVKIVSQGTSLSKDQVKTLIVDIANQYGVDPNLALRIANAESGYNCRSQNTHSSAGGVYQFIDGTFLSTQKQMGHKQDITLKYDCVENITLAMWKIAHGGISAWDASATHWK